MPAPSDKPLKKVTLNLFEEDVAYMVATYGNGWTSEVRERLSNFIKERKRLSRQIDAGFGEQHG